MAIQLPINTHNHPLNHQKIHIIVIQNTTYNNLIQLIPPNNIFTPYHTLHPSILSNQQTITSLNKKESAWVARLFQSEIELKVQIILSTNYFRTNYFRPIIT
eukprot:178806_1